MKAINLTEKEAQLLLSIVDHYGSILDKVSLSANEDLNKVVSLAYSIEKQLKNR